MKKILMVDEDKATLSMLSDGLTSFDEFEILTAERVKLAAQLLNILKIDLVLTEIKMPDVDGFKFLAYLKKKYSKIPIIVVTGHGSDQVRARVNALGISHYFEKPPDMEVLSKRIWEELDISTEGRIYGINLASFLQLIDIEDKTCTLTVKSGNNTGYIYCHNGELIGAETEELRGKDALYEIMCWDKTKIQIEDVCRKMEREINSPLMRLLMESQRIKDEETVDIQEDMTGQALFEGDENVLGDGILDQNGELLTEEAMGETASIGDTGATQPDNIEKILDKSYTIFEYGIFDDADGLRNEKKQSAFLRKFKPSVYWDLSGQLEQVLNNGNLKYMIIKQKRGLRYALFPHNGKRIFVVLGPGTPPINFMTDMLRSLH